MRFIIWLLTYAAGLALAAFLLDGIWFEGPITGEAELKDMWLPLLIVALILGLVSTFIEPVIKLVSIPFIILSFGFMLIVINALMLMLAAKLADAFNVGFHVDGFWNAVLGAIIITLAGWGVRTAMPRTD